jgi:hypothetical protein
MEGFTERFVDMTDEVGCASSHSDVTIAEVFDELNSSADGLSGGAFTASKLFG